MKNIYLLFALLLWSGVVSGQSTSGCNCNVTITQAGAYDNKNLKVQPGQTVCIRAGRYDFFRFQNFVGTADQPIRFINCGGEVRIGVESYVSGFQFNACRHFVVSGSGDSTKAYGFIMDKTHSSTSGMIFGMRSSDFEIERVRIDTAGYAGMLMRIDPSCDTVDVNTYNIRIHDNIVRGVYGIGMQLGSAFPETGVDMNCNGTTRRVYPGQHYGLQVYNNLIEQTGGKAMTILNAPGAIIRDNTIRMTSLNLNGFGIQPGGDPACGCDYTVTKPGTFDNTWLNIEPGKTICVKAGQYNMLRFNNFIGTAAQPFKFINSGGLVRVGAEQTATGIQLNNCRFFRMTGTGDPSLEYGFLLDRSYRGYSAVTVANLSTDCELDHIEVAKAGFAGFMIKSDPNCDPATWRENFTMYNVRIHDNYVHDVGGEGLYLGNSFYGTGMSANCSGQSMYILPHLIYGLDVYNNRIERTGCEGIQYACAPDARIHHNYIKDTGLDPFANGQSNGLQIGGGAGGQVYNNVIINAAAMGIILVGHLGNNYIYNNVVSNSGGDGVFCDDRIGSASGTTVSFVNNTIQGSGRDGIRMYNEINTNIIVNNAITGYSRKMDPTLWYAAGKPVLLAYGSTAYQAGNYASMADSNARYTDQAANDFSPKLNSPLLDAGIDAAPFGVTLDLLDKPRKVNGAYDVGAYESQVSRSARMAATEAAPYLTEVVTVQAYPSPCVEQVTIPVPAGKGSRLVRVYSADGKLLAREEPAENSTSVKLQTGTWAFGTYTFIVTVGSSQFNGRFLKQ